MRELAKEMGDFAERSVPQTLHSIISQRQPRSILENGTPSYGHDFSTPLKSHKRNCLSDLRCRKPKAVEMRRFSFLLVLPMISCANCQNKEQVDVPTTPKAVSKQSVNQEIEFIDYNVVMESLAESILLPAHQDTWDYEALLLLDTSEIETISRIRPELVKEFRNDFSLPIISRCWDSIRTEEASLKGCLLDPKTLEKILLNGIIKLTE